MWTLAIEDDQGNKTTLQLSRDSYSIGRGPDATVRLTERNVSREHALLERQGSDLIFTDLRSYNGSYVNGVRVARPEPLHHGDLIHLGDYRITVQNLALDEQARATASQFSQEKRKASRTVTRSNEDRLVVLVGPSPGQEFSLRGERILVGRGDECDIKITHVSISRVHAEIRRLDKGRYEVLDKGSANGVRVNGRDLTRTLLDNRDVLELGDVALKYIPQGQVFHADKGAAERIVALSGSPPPPPPGTHRTSLRAGLIAAGLGALLVVLGVVLFQDTLPLSGEETLTASEAISQARSAYQQGDLLESYELMSQVEKGHPLRESATFQNLQEQWAEELLRVAEARQLAPALRPALEEIVHSDELAPGLRERASVALLRMDQEPASAQDEAPPEVSPEEEPESPEYQLKEAEEEADEAIDVDDVDEPTP